MDNNIDKDILRDERIDAYFRGEMTAEEEAQFMKDVAADEDLRQKVVALARLAKGMKDVGEEQDELVKSALSSVSVPKLQDIVADVLDEELGICADRVSYVELAKQEKERAKVSETARYAANSKTERKSSFKKWSAILSVAASVAILIVVGVQYHSYSVTTGLGEEYYMSFESSTIRGTEDNINKRITPLFEMVKQGKDLDKAITELTKMWDQASKDEYNDYTEYAPEIGWNLTIAHLKDNNRNQAKEVLTQLIPLLEENSTMYNKAIELKDKL